MYKIIGADQRVYGPVDTAQMRLWIAQGRVNAQTRIQPEGATDWKPLSAFPEFADVMIAPAPSPTAVVERKKALESVKPAAIALKIFAVVGWFWVAIEIVANILGMVGVETGMPRTLPGIFSSFGGGAGILQSLVQVVVEFLVWQGGSKMQVLENYQFAMMASILVMLPCIQPCLLCIVGVPMGIWSLVVLNKPGVKLFFT